MSAYWDDKSVHKPSGVGRALCGVHNKTYAFKTSVYKEKINCKRCLKKIKKKGASKKR